MYLKTLVKISIYTKKENLLDFRNVSIITSRAPALTILNFVHVFLNKLWFRQSLRKRYLQRQKQHQ